MWYAADLQILHDESTEIECVVCECCVAVLLPVGRCEQMPSLNFAPLLLAVINLKRRLQNRKDHVRIEKESGMAILVTHHEC